MLLLGMLRADLSCIMTTSFCMMGAVWRVGNSVEPKIINALEQLAAALPADCSMIPEYNDTTLKS